LCLEPVVDADGMTEMGEIGATTHIDVLAGIEELAAVGIGKGAGSTAESLTCFEKGDLKAVCREGGRGCEAGEAGADNEDTIAHARKFTNGGDWW
jgi:hypothetical protein